MAFTLCICSTAKAMTLRSLETKMTSGTWSVGFQSRHLMADASLATTWLAKPNSHLMHLRSGGIEGGVLKKEFSTSPEFASCQITRALGIQQRDFLVGKTHRGTSDKKVNWQISFLPSCRAMARAMTPTRLFNQTCTGIPAVDSISFSPGFVTLAHAELTQTIGLLPMFKRYLMVGGSLD